nr:hypothetical protein [Bacillus cereus]
MTAEEAKKELSNKKHSIEGMWNAINKHVQLQSCFKENDTYMCAKEYIIKLQGIDSTSSKFRYPFDKDLTPFYTKKKKYDVKSISNCFVELFVFLDSLHSMLEANREVQTEIEAELRDYIDY